MNARQLAYLFSFNLRLIPSSTWTLLGALSFDVILVDGLMYRWVGLREESGLSDQISSFTSVFSIIMGIQLFLTSGMGPTYGLPSAAEFLWVLPIPRRTAYFCRIFLYFLIILILPLAQVGLTVPDPDLRLSLYHSKTYRTEAADKLALYQAQFPASSVVRLPRAGHDILIIPGGAALIALWQTWLVLLLALTLQVVALQPLPQKTLPGIFVRMGLGFVPLVLIGSSLFPEQKDLMEKAFFLFIHDWILLGLATLGAFFLVQRLAWKWVQNLEIV